MNFYVKKKSHVKAILKVDGNKGSCSSDCGFSENSLAQCSSNELGNKQGPVCWVGVFGQAKIVACSLNQKCQVKIFNCYIYLNDENLYLFKFFIFKRKINHNSISGVISEGSCVDVCVLSKSVTCCSSDLCNGYNQEIVQKRMLLPFNNGANKNRYTYNFLRGLIIYSVIILF